MEASTILTLLLQLGTMLHDVLSKTGHTDGSDIDWSSVIQSDAFRGVAGTVAGLAETLAGVDDVQPAVDEIDAKQASLLKGRLLPQLSVEELVQYSALARARLLLTTKALTSAMKGDFQSWLVDDALPDLVRVVPIVLPLLV
jgi:hypothetical protein